LIFPSIPKKPTPVASKKAPEAPPPPLWFPSAKTEGDEDKPTASGLYIPKAKPKSDDDDFVKIDDRGGIDLSPEEMKAQIDKYRALREKMISDEWENVRRDTHGTDQMQFRDMNSKSAWLSEAQMPAPTWATEEGWSMEYGSMGAPKKGDRPRGDGLFSFDDDIRETMSIDSGDGVSPASQDDDQPDGFMRK
jgi:hypothetical protein